MASSLNLQFDTLFAPTTHQHRVLTNPRHLRLVERAVYSVVIMNAIDAIMTIMWVSGGLASEANPLMEWLLHIHPALFMVAKLALVFLGAGLLWRHREKQAAAAGIALLCLVYYFIAVVHAFGLGLVIAYLFV